MEAVPLRQPQAAIARRSATIFSSRTADWHGGMTRLTADSFSTAGTAIASGAICAGAEDADQMLLKSNPVAVMTETLIDTLATAAVNNFSDQKIALD